MSLLETATQKPTDPAGTTEQQRQPHTRWPYVCVAVTGPLVAAWFLWPPYRWNRSIVLLGLDQSAWGYLVTLASAIAFCAALIGIANNLERNHHRWWQSIPLNLFSLAVIAAMFLAAIPALFIGTLSFDSSYRDLGNAHGDGIVVQYQRGWDNPSLRFGVRSGAWVDFEPTATINLRDSTSLSDWNFALSSSPTRTQVRYTCKTCQPTRGAITVHTH